MSLVLREVVTRLGTSLGKKRRKIKTTEKEKNEVVVRDDFVERCRVDATLKDLSVDFHVVDILVIV